MLVDLWEMADRLNGQALDLTIVLDEALADHGDNPLIKKQSELETVQNATRAARTHLKEAEMQLRRAADYRERLYGIPAGTSRASRRCTCKKRT